MVKFDEFTDLRLDYDPVSLYLRAKSNQFTYLISLLMLSLLDAFVSVRVRFVQRNLIVLVVDANATRPSRHE